MKIITILFILINLNSISQRPNDRIHFDSVEVEKKFSVISMNNSPIIYRLYPNDITYYSELKYDSIWVEATNSKVIYGKDNNCQVIPEKGENKYCTISLMGLNGKDTIEINSRPCKIKDIQNPRIQLGSVIIKDGIDELTDSLFFNSNRFFLIYNSDVFISTSCMLDEISISIDDKEFVMSQSYLPDYFKKAYFEAPKNAKITFNYYVFTETFAHTSEKVILSTVYHKKTKKKKFTPFKK